MGKPIQVLEPRKVKGGERVVGPSDSELSQDARGMRNLAFMWGIKDNGRGSSEGELSRGLGDRTSRYALKHEEPRVDVLGEGVGGLSRAYL